MQSSNEYSNKAFAQIVFMVFDSMEIGLMPAKKVCFFVESRSNKLRDWLRDEIVRPVINTEFREFELRFLFDLFQLSGRLRDNVFLEALNDADLVVADLTNNDPD